MLSICLSINIHIYVCINLLTYAYVYLSIYLCIYLYIYLSRYLFISVYTFSGAFILKSENLHAAFRAFFMYFVFLSQRGALWVTLCHLVDVVVVVVAVTLAPQLSG